MFLSGTDVKINFITIFQTYLPKNSAQKVICSSTVPQ